MKNMKQFKKSLTITAILLVLFSCKENSEPIEITPDHFHTAIDKVVDVMIHDIFSPPVASRVFVYPNIAAYEILAQNDTILLFSGKPDKTFRSDTLSRSNQSV